MGTTLQKKKRTQNLQQKRADVPKVQGHGGDNNQKIIDDQNSIYDEQKSGISLETDIPDYYSQVERTIDPNLKYDYSELVVQEDFFGDFYRQFREWLKNPFKTSFSSNEQFYELRNHKIFYKHSFVKMVHYAYYHHFPLSFSPDDIQLLIVQGFSHYINHNQDKYKNKFVQHEGKKEISVELPDLNYDTYDWINIINQFSKQIKKNIGKDRYNLFVQKFSTTDQCARICQEVNLLEALFQWFYTVGRGGCGISQIRLKGTLDDWIQLRKSVEKLREFDLDWWVDQLALILDQFVCLYIGEIDFRFWETIYSHQHVMVMIIDLNVYRVGLQLSFLSYFNFHKIGMILGRATH